MTDIQELLQTAAGNEPASFGVGEVWQRARVIRRRRIISFATIASVAVIVLFWVAGTRFELFGSNPPQPATPAPQRTESSQREPRTNVRIATGPDDSWTLFAGVDETSDTLCLSLGGKVCSTTSPRPGFVLMSTFAEPEETGFLFGPVNADVHSLELVTADAVAPVRLRLRDFPERLGLGQLRFFVHPVGGEGKVTVVARGRDGSVLQKTDYNWGSAEGPGIFFPTWTGDSKPLAIVGGALMEENRCLFLRFGGTRFLPLWERGYTYADGSLRDETGKLVAEVGEAVRGGAGYYSDLAYVEDLVGQPIPRRCQPEGTEPYVLIYDVERGPPS